MNIMKLYHNSLQGILALHEYFPVIEGLPHVRSTGRRFVRIFPAQR